MVPRRIQRAEVEAIKQAILSKQGGRCALCMKVLRGADACLDHDHRTGYLRGVLCRNCNGMEGKIFNRANRAKRTMTVIQWATRLVKYWMYHQTPRINLLHWTHKTEAEKRAIRAAKARARRAKK